jgi:hypothetical protein
MTFVLLHLAEGVFCKWETSMLWLFVVFLACSVAGDISCAAIHARKKMLMLCLTIGIKGKRF